MCCEAPLRLCVKVALFLVRCQAEGPSSNLSKANFSIILNLTKLLTFSDITLTNYTISDTTRRIRK